MRQTAVLLKHIPLIKFVGGPHSFSTASPVAKAHPLGTGVLPSGSSGSSASESSYHNTNPIEAKDGEFFSRAELPARFQYKAPKESEIEDISSGGANLVW